MSESANNGIYLKKLLVYPVKSCAPIPMEKWNLVETGLKYDRLWVIISPSGDFLSLRRAPSMYAIVPSFDFENGHLCLDYKDLPTLRVPLDVSDAEIMNAKIFKKFYPGHDCGDEASQWLDEIFIENGCRLLRQTRKIREGKYKINQQQELLTYVDASQYLVVCKPSVEWLANKLNEKYELCEQEEEFWTVEKLMYRFRANLCLEGTEKEFEEENWERIEINGTKFQVHEPCTRCKATCVSNEESAYAGSEPLQIINQIHRQHFGIYMGKINTEDGELAVGSKIKVLKLKD